jgi:hypothetical protein
MHRNVVFCWYWITVRVDFLVARIFVGYLAIRMASRLARGVVIFITVPLVGRTMWVKVGRCR